MRGSMAGAVGGNTVVGSVGMMSIDVDWSTVHSSEQAGYSTYDTVGAKLRKQNGIKKVDFRVEPRKMWHCLQFEKGDKPWGDSGLGGNVTLMGAFCQLDRATIARG
uniref:Uncharacterized protein n=1 Tax=Romanomermis culicivorax TaxID=13658 RepID=A0A915JEK6_ROMCU